jgi:hypothetical protein
MQEEIVAFLKVGKPRVSRCIGQFYQIALIPPVFLIKHGEDYPFHNSPRLKVRSVEN